MLVPFLFFSVELLSLTEVCSCPRIFAASPAWGPDPSDLLPAGTFLLFRSQLKMSPALKGLSSATLKQLAHNCPHSLLHILLLLPRNTYHSMV